MKDYGLDNLTLPKFITMGATIMATAFYTTDGDTTERYHTEDVWSLNCRDWKEREHG